MKKKTPDDGEQFSAEYPNKVNEKLKKLDNLLRSLVDDRFTGYIKINYSQGNIGRVEKFEEILKR